MSPTGHTILARFPLALLDRLVALGADRQSLIEHTGVDAGWAGNPDERVPVSRHWELWRVGIEMLDRPSLGLELGQGWMVRDAGLVGYAMLHSPTLGDAIERLVRYERILEDTTLLTLEQDERELRLLIDEPLALTGLRHTIEFDLTACARCFREITGDVRIPREVHIPYPRPADVEPYRRELAPVVEFDRPRAALVFRDEDRELPVVARDDSLCKYLDRHAETVLDQLTSASFAQRVQRVLWEALPHGQPTVRDVATRLGLSSRTLQRRLAEEGLSFADLLDRFRERMAVELLQRDDLAIYEVAYLLGYSEPSTFFRAFRRWKRTSPRRFRRTALEDRLSKSG